MNGSPQSTVDSWPQRLSRKILAFFWVILCLPGIGQSQTPKPKFPLPALLICEKKRPSLAHVNSHGKLDWDYTLDGPPLDIQPQPSGHYLVAGGSQNVFLLRRVWKGGQILWDWSELGTLSIQSAVGVDWNESGDPDLILAADASNQRLFLAEGKSKGVKIRWEYKLPSPPISARVCPDSNYFLAVLEDSTVEEIFYQEDKVVWSIGKEDGLKDVRDAVRGPWGQTYVAEGADGLIICFDPGKKQVWKTHLPFAPSSSFQDIGLFIYKKNGKRLVMASVHWPGGPGARDVIYLLNAETGKVVDWSEHTDKGGYPSFHKVVPDLTTYSHK